jgi:hypothetical protein
MTSQIPDFFNYRDSKYNVVGLNGKGLLLPQDFGVSPTAFSTACLRGYYIEYACEDKSLVLESISLRLDKNTEHKEVEGISPVGDTDQFFDISDGRFFLYKYRNLKVPILFSGGFLIAKDFVREMDIAEIPQSYENVFELSFDNGKLKKVTDWSELVARNRADALAHKPDHFKVEFFLKYDSLYYLHMEQYA